MFEITAAKIIAEYGWVVAAMGFGGIVHATKDYKDAIKNGEEYPFIFLPIQILHSLFSGSIFGIAALSQGMGAPSVILACLVGCLVPVPVMAKLSSLIVELSLIAVKKIGKAWGNGK